MTRLNRVFLVLLAIVVSAVHAHNASADRVAPQSVVQPVVSTNINLVAKDGVKIFGQYYQAASPKAIILLFHQAGTNKAEYASIAPRLVSAGYSALAIDQRSGGTQFGADNETVKGLAKGTKEQSYLQAKPDLEAAIAWGVAQNKPLIIWGSSYSAALVYVLAAENPSKITAALVFSGGDYLGKKQVVNAAKKVTTPFFATSAMSEVKEMTAVFNNLASTNKVFFKPSLGGVHGSSTLIAKENPKGAEENWAAVLAFLATVVK
jgi:dienelactone hydrolase